ncbi:MAG: lysophospholipid acyltransferase family protein [Bradymonadia bacterium]
MYWLLSAPFRLALRIFYKVSLGGYEFPKAGPVLLVANHPNGLIDPLLVMLASPRPVRFLGKAPLFKMPVIGWLMRALKCLPVYRSQDGAGTHGNENTFSAVSAALQRGEVVCLFPEGISHDEPMIQPMKTGAARMVVAAMTGSSKLDSLNIVAMGLHYPRKSIFRSRASVLIAEPMTIDANEVYTDNEDDRTTVLALTERIRRAINGVTVNLSDWAHLPLVELAHALRAGDAESHADIVQIVAQADTLYHDNPERLLALKARMEAFLADLRWSGLSSVNFDELSNTGAQVRPVLAPSLRYLTLAFCAVPGVIAYAIPYFGVRLVERSRRDERDVVATVKLLSGMVLFVLWQILLGLAIYWGIGSHLWAGCSLALPVFGWLALRWVEEKAHLRRQLTYGLARIARPRLASHLRCEAAAIAGILAELAEDDAGRRNNGQRGSDTGFPA